jgi:hypothetical protein
MIDSRSFPDLLTMTVDKVEAARLEIGMGRPIKGKDKMERERTRVQQAPWTAGPRERECRTKRVETRRTRERKGN